MQSLHGASLFVMCTGGKSVPSDQPTSMRKLLTKLINFDSIAKNEWIFVI